MAEKRDSINGNEEVVLNPIKLFAFLIGAGILAIAVGTYFNNTIVNLAIPISIMVYYAYTIYKEDEGITSIEQKADSVYYMGFIYTLVAMTASLVALANNDKLDFNSVVINFGLALSTTIIGLVVRIMWLQLKSQDFEDAESILKDRVIEQARSLSSESDNLITKITALSSQMEDASNVFKKNFKRLGEAFDSSEEISYNLNGLKESAQSINQAFSTTNTYLHNLNQNLSTVNLQISETANVPYDINLALSQIRETSSLTMDDFRSLSESINSLNRSAESLNNDLANSLNSVVNTITSTQNELQRNNLVLEQNNNQTNEVFDEFIENFKGSVENFQQSISILENSFSATVNTINERNIELQDTISQSLISKEADENSAEES